MLFDIVPRARGETGRPAERAHRLPCPSQSARAFDPHSRGLSRSLLAPVRPANTPSVSHRYLSSPPTALLFRADPTGSRHSRSLRLCGTPRSPPLCRPPHVHDDPESTSDGVCVSGRTRPAHSRAVKARTGEMDVVHSELPGHEDERPYRDDAAPSRLPAYRIERSKRLRSAGAPPVALWLRRTHVVTSK